MLPENNEPSASRKRGPGRRFQPGQSGNAGGRPAQLVHVREAARSHTAAAIATLVEIMANPNEPASARARAAEILLARGWGQPESHMALDHTGDLTITRVDYRWMSDEELVAIASERPGAPAVTADAINNWTAKTLT
jgi:hypothetical protein